MEYGEQPSITQVLSPVSKEKKVEDIADSYLKFYNEKKPENPQNITADEVKSLAINYYDVATDFFEYGWGESFHFGVINQGETREQAIVRHEHKLALKMGLKSGDTVLDIGCGVGGPARHIASFSGAKVIGLNINDYQLGRARKLTNKVNLDNLCEFVKGDFCNIPYPDNTFTRVYAIEASCHASDDLTRVYGDVYRVLKPGGMFAFYEWIMTDKYDSNKKEHKNIKDDILIGDGLPDLVSAAMVKQCLTKVGFELVEDEDLALSSPVPWYSTLQPSWKVSDFKLTPLGRWFTHSMLKVMETVWLVPKGSCKVHTTLCKGADGLVEGGKLGIFTPMYLVVVRKPDTS